MGDASKRVATVLSNKFTMVNGIVLFENKIYVPSVNAQIEHPAIGHKISLRKHLVIWIHRNWSLHSSPTKTARITRWYFGWPDLTVDVKEVILTCLECRKMARSEEKVSKWSPTRLPRGIFQVLVIDHLTDLPETPEGFNCILRVVCGLSGWGWIIPVKGRTLETVWKNLCSVVFSFACTMTSMYDSEAVFQA